MRGLGEIKTNSLMTAFASGMAEAMAVRRCALDARAARAEAEMSIRARAEFFANMNHELRTPLNAIIGFATMLKESATYQVSAEQREAYADYVLQSADLLLAHIDTLIEAAALDGGELTLDAAPVDLSTTLAEAVKRAGVAASAAKVALELKSEGPPVEGWGDHVRMGQAIDHVIRTAIKFSPPGGRVLVRALTDKDGWAEIAVRDRGEGMAPEAVEKALRAFEETHRGLDRSFAGPGIGLAIAKTFVELQGGRFSIKSKPGEGTLVRIALPPPKAEPAADAARMRLAG